MFISLTAIVALISVMALLVHPAAEERPDASLASDAWLEAFSLRAYRPMLRLASRDDGNYLKSARETGDFKRYRRIQRTLLREYLRSLSRDFQRLHAIAAEKSLRVKGGDGNSMALFEQHIGFIFHIWSIEARLLLRALIPHSIDLAPLLANVESLAADTRELIRPPLRFRPRALPQSNLSA
ncbi:MAG: hypothetical protein ABSB15_22955 [Bryobacteraceae bacterium]